MVTAYRAITILLATVVMSSGVAKFRRDPKVVRVIHEIVGVPLRYLQFLAVCEVFGALGLVVGMAWPPLGIAAAIGVVLYFLGATISHLRVGDVRGIGPAAFILAMALAALALRILTSKASPG